MVTVGMLDIKNPAKNLKAYPFAGVAKAEGIDFFCFRPSDVDLENKTVQGHFYENGSWVVKETNFPDVIYNSNSQAKCEKDQIIIEALRFLIPFTSYPVGDKIEVFEMLNKSDNFSSCLPETKEVKDVNDSMDFIIQMKDIVLKPRHGRKGTGIIFISCKEEMYEFTMDNNTRILSEAELRNSINEIIPKAYLAQQYIDDTCHATFQAMKSAIEVLCQQGEDGRKKIAVLGTMPELGIETVEYHRAIGKLLCEKGVDVLITFGMNTRHYRHGAIEAGFPRENIHSFYDLENLNKFFLENVSSDTVFLFKGARRINLGKSAEDFINYMRQNHTNTK